MTLFQLTNITLSSGVQSKWKVECDSLTDEDLDTCAMLLAERLPPFSIVLGVPRGGVRLARAIRKYATSGAATTLLVDDVLTTGGSLERARRGVDDIGAVIFARGPVPYWITPLWTLSEMNHGS